MEDLVFIVEAVLAAIVTFALILCGVAGIAYQCENVPLRIYMDGKEIYHGRSACVSTESIGSSARVDTKQGPFCLFPKEYFAGKDLVIKTEN